MLCKCPALELERARWIPEKVTMSHMVTDPEACRKILVKRFPDLKTTTHNDDGATVVGV